MGGYVAYEETARRSGKPRDNCGEQTSKQHASKQIQTLYGKGTFSLKGRGAGDVIVPRRQLQHKPQHIESVMAVNGTARAMKGSD